MAHILIVDDEMIIALGASMVLEDEGHKVKLASNGEAGLREALASDPDLIISDYMMPRMDGLQMIRALRELGKTTPVILMSAVPEALLPTGPGPIYDAYLSKPYHDWTLVEAVSTLLSEKDAAG